MEYNIHPIFVHFPIALLLIYSVFKILPLSRWMPKVEWRQIERVFLLLGIMGAAAAIFTGEIAEEIARPDHQVVELHSTLAWISALIYGSLLLGEFASVVKSYVQNNSSLLRVLVLFERVLCNKVISVILALAGLIAITLTGMIGGVMVYGLSADPFSGFILKLFGIDY